MLGRISAFCVSLLVAAIVILGTGTRADAQDAVWRVSKSSGEVSVTSAEGERSALIAGATLKPGDNVRTGQNGRVLLMRGEESILVSPNSAIGIPKGRAEGALPTSIIQQSGSILLEVEKRNVQHFQVETPYLAAVVKGTQFRVTVEGGASRVDVLRGQVEVADFKTGQYALLNPGQVAEAVAQGRGLSLSGSGTLNPIQQGTPRTSSVSPLPEAAAPAVAKPTEQKVAAALSISETEWLHASSRASADNSGSWISAFSQSSGVFGNSRGRRSRNEDIAVTLGFSVAVGAAVALLVSVQRRRKSKKTIQS